MSDSNSDFQGLLESLRKGGTLSSVHLRAVLDAMLEAGLGVDIVHTLEEYRLADLGRELLSSINTMPPTPAHGIQMGLESVDWSASGADSIASWGKPAPDDPIEANYAAPLIDRPDALVGPEESAAPPKFETIGELARGGVGVINLVRDKDLLRTIVMKTLIDGKKADEYVHKKFVEEAQITSQLEHPNIVPVHEFGRFTGGEVFFTMKRIQGRTLKDVLSHLRRGDEATSEEFGRTRLINIFQGVCMAIAFAHNRGVIHRDIKPSNVMIGDFGETLVLDWGVAKVIGSDDDTPLETEMVVTDRSESDDSTMVGLITGTPSYMAPEQAAGRVDRLDERSDVYALGALLYEILCLKPPFKRKSHRDTLKAVITETPVPPSVRSPERGVPAALEDICLKCLSKRRSGRYQNTKEIIDALMQYLAGVEDLDRRARQSEERLKMALGHIDSFNKLRARIADAKERVDELEWETPLHAPIEDKRTLWSAQTQVKSIDDRMRTTFSAATNALVEAIGFNPNNDEACNELARMYWSKYKEALSLGDGRAADEYRALVATYDRGAYTEQLRGEARIIIRTHPSGVRVTAHALRDQDHQRVPMEGRDLGVTPLNNIPLPEGDWLLILKLAGFRDIKHTLTVRRSEVSELSCQFFDDEVVGQHFLYVPGGRFEMGGDASCAIARQRRVVESTDIFFARYPVTCAEYLAFIRSIGRRSAKEATQRAPRVRNGGTSLWDLDDGGAFMLPTESREGYRWEPHWPVFGISFNDAQAYCQWYSQRTGTAVRLPTEEEWEKAARGADGRLYPWGNHFDPLFCKMASSRPGSALPERVGSYRIDCSAYGIYDMAGLVREYCNSSFSKDEDLRIVRGGSYLTNNDAGCRTTWRQVVRVNEPALDHGFRVVRDTPAGQASTARRLVRPQF